MGIQWHRVFDDALTTTDVIAVAVAVQSYLAREPTRSQLQAARRAANSYARHSNAQTLYVAAETGQRGPRRVLLLARADADLDNAERLHAVAARRAASPPRRGRARHEPQIAETIATAVVKAGRSARQLDVGKLDHQHASTLVDELTQPLHDLERLRQRLRARADSAPLTDEPRP